MTDITFIYRINTDTNVYYGKCDYDELNINKDHFGLDLEVENVLLEGLNNYRAHYNLPLLKSDNITVGIISCGSHILNYTTRKERNCFDFYYTKHTKYDDNTPTEEFYIKGAKLKKQTSIIAEPKYNNYVLEVQEIED